MELEDLKKICCYQETTNTTTVGITYLDYVYSDNQKAKRALRNSAIDALLDESKVPEYNKVKEDIQSGEFFERHQEYKPIAGGQIGSLTQLPTQLDSPEIGLKVMHISIIPSKLVSEKTIEDDIVLEWINQARISFVTRELAKTKTDKLILSNLSSHNSIENDMTIFRRFFTRCLGFSNMISVKNRRGPATTILTNPNIIEKIQNINDLLNPTYSNGGLNLVYSDIVPKNHVVILRNIQTISDDFSIGYHINRKDNLYYYFTSPNLNKMCGMFEVI